jgi:hypothetical protein
MLKLRVRWSWVVAVLAVAAVTALGFVAWPYFKYPGAFERAAAGHLDKVTVEGFGYIGEDATENDAVSRFWMRRGTSADTAPAITYAGQQLRRDFPGRASLTETKFEKELGWLHLPDENVPCALSASQVKKEPPAGATADLSNADWGTVEAGAVTLIQVVVTCGGG